MLAAVHLRKICFGALSGLLSGLAAAAFLALLDWATATRNSRPVIIWALPVAGLFIGWLYHHYGKDVARGHGLIFDEIHDPKAIVPIKMAPFVLLGTIVTHLFGGSAGREGTAVQMGASLSDQIGRIFKINPVERGALLVAGTGAGFGAAIGAPWAGAVFGMEVIHVGRLRPVAWLECLIASFVGYYTTVLLGARHSTFPSVGIPELNLKIVVYVALAGIVFGLGARAFIAMTHLVERGVGLVAYPPLRPFLAGVLLVVLYYLEGSYKYVGLGIPVIQDGLSQIQSFREPVLKAVFTAITVGGGFKGGEFVPLVFIGTTLGSALATIIPVTFQMLASLGFAAVFAGAANAPIACSLMAIEIFGVRIAPYAIIACLMSYYCSGHHGIFKSQRLEVK